MTRLGTASGTIFDHFPKPACAELLGWTLLDHDAAKGWVRIAFEAGPTFLNPAGFVQGAC
jgi:acyl-coenzyme A thioesterase PaaI-like protein